MSRILFPATTAIVVVLVGIVMTSSRSPAQPGGGPQPIPGYECNPYDCTFFGGTKNSTDCLDNGLCDLSNAASAVMVCYTNANDECQPHNPPTTEKCTGQCVESPLRPCEVKWLLCDQHGQ